MSKKKKIIMISLAVTLALAVGVGGFVYAQNGFPHKDVGANKLIGVGEMGNYCYDCELEGYWDQYQEWDTQFIVTNPNCEQDLTIEWVALIAGEDVYYTYDGPDPYWYAEEVIFEGTPEDWYYAKDIDIPGNYDSYRGVLSPHEVWQVSLSDLLYWDLYELDLSKYTLEITWSSTSYTGWWWYRGRVRPLTGWQKEKCWSEFMGNGGYPSFAISEAEMKNFESRTPFALPDWWYPGWWD